MPDEVLFGDGISASKDLFAQVIAASRDCIKIIGLDGSLREMSLPGRVAMEVDDFSAVCGLPWAELWPAESRALVRESVARATLGQRSVFEAFCPTAKGKARWWDVTVAPIRNDEGAVVAILSLSRDISDQKQALQALNHSLGTREVQLVQVSEELARESARLVEMRRQLAHSEKVKLLGAFVGHIVHDMNNVLGILASTFRLVRRHAGDAVPKVLFAQGEEAVERGSTIVRQLLDFARGGEDELEDVDIGAALQSWRDMLSHLVGRDVTLELAIEPGLPRIATRTSALQSVLFNLVANARDAMPQGGKLTVGVKLVHSAARGDKLRLFIRDEGMGMPPHVLARAGEPFFSTKGEGKGTGLGLASAFEFARASDGRVEIESVEGEGTTVALLMPLSGPVADTPLVEMDETLRALHGGAELLLVEEDADQRAALIKCLRALGYTVLVAASLPMALALAKAHPSVAVVLACGAHARALREAFEDKPQVPPFITWGEAGDAETLPVPLDLNCLVRRLPEVLGRLTGRRLVPAVLAAAERLSTHALSDEARKALDIWIQKVAEERVLPSPQMIAVLPETSRESFLVEVIVTAGQALFRYIEMAQGLSAKLSHAPESARFTGQADEGLGSLALAYSYCETGFPYFDFVQDDNGQFSFERLVLPLSADGQAVTHLAGFIRTAQQGQESGSAA